MKFYLPSFSSSAARDLNNKKPPEAQDESDENINSPNASEYVNVAAREFLSVLEAVAQQVPIPGFDAIVKVALNIVKACDDSQTTLTRAEDLKIRIKTLVAVFIKELQGKKREEIQDKLLEDIESLKRDIEHIQSTLDKIASQHRLLLIFFRQLNATKINKCITRLDDALERFNLVRNISFTEMLAKLEKQIMKSQLIMDNVKAMLDEHFLTGATSSPSRAPIPINTASSMAVMTL